MRIDLLTTELRTGGAERCVTELALGLQAAGDQVRVFSLAPLPEIPEILVQTGRLDEGPPGQERSARGTPLPGHRSELLSRLHAAGIEVSSAGAKSVWSLPRTYRAVRRWLKAGQPEVLQTFLYHGNLIGTLAGVAAGVPVRVGGIRVAEPHRWRSWSERVAVRRMHALVCVSESVKKFAEARLHPPRQTRLLTIPNGVRVASLVAASPRDWIQDGVRPGCRVLLFVGRLHPQKGVDLLLKAAPVLLEQHPDAALVIVGSGPMEAEVEQAVAALPAGRAIHLPWQSDVASLYAAAEIVVVPSRFEGMPNVVLEAMAAARPVVAAEVEGVAELLGVETARQSYPAGDSAAMIDRISDLLGNRNLRELGEANRRRAAASFSLSVMIDRYRGLYQELLAAAR